MHALLSRENGNRGAGDGHKQSTSRVRLLVVDDQRSLRVTLAMMLRDRGYDVDEAAEGTSGLQMALQATYDVVLTDLRMGEHDGIDLLRHIKEQRSETEVIMMTAYGTIENAVAAMRLGAFDYIQKPFREEEILTKVGNALATRRHKSPQSGVIEQPSLGQFDSIIGRSPAMCQILHRVTKLAPTDAVVLITGESGTGKELIARAVHAHSRRVDEPFVTINCAAVTESLLESELFGHARGAFTGAVSARRGLFEEASGGTFFFDEIAETTPAFQAKLLRALQEGEVRRVGENRPVNVDIRVIAATNVDLKTAVRERRFRQDLYYRLNVARFDLPPLRRRKSDIPPLADFFLDHFNKKLSFSSHFGPGVLDALMAYDFPGNVRELENIVEQAVALSGGGMIRGEDIGAELVAHLQAPRRALADTISGAERSAIENALREFGGNREKAAQALGISVTTLWRKMTRLGITYDVR